MAYITMTERDQEVLSIISASLQGEITVAVAAVRLDITERQVYRIRFKVRTSGASGVIHALRGITSNRSLSNKKEEEILTHLHHPDWYDFQPTFAQEQLAKRGITVCVETVRTIMIRENLWKPRSRTRNAHRQWRERRAMKGELIQFDGSYFPWLGEEVGELCLLAAIDDATGEIQEAHFMPHEGVIPVFSFWKQYCERRGVPHEVYLDKFGTYKINHKTAVDDPTLMTQFERAMQQLNVRVIHAHSPQAKGRVERLFKTLQSRVPKEFRLAGITTVTEAECYLQEVYIPAHNKQFGVTPRTAGDAHRSPPLIDIDRIFSVVDTRVVSNDFTLRYKNMWLQLNARQETLVLRGDVIRIEKRLTGSIHLYLREKELHYSTGISKPISKKKYTALSTNTPRYVPDRSHPWKSASYELQMKKRLEKNRIALKP